MTDRARADHYLDTIVAALRSGAHWKPRDLLDPWFAFEVGGSQSGSASFLTRGGQPHTFDYPCPHQHWQRLRHPHFWVTPAAEAVLSRGERGDPEVKKLKTPDRTAVSELVRLSVDHAVPVARLKKEIETDDSLWTADKLRSFLLHHFRRGVMLKSEDDRLNDTRIDGVSLRADMPPTWRAFDDPFARYQAMNPPLKRQAYPGS